MFDKQTFAKRLRELRERKELNQKECAEKLGISRGSISFYENGERLPDIETIYNMAKFFSVSADYLIGLSDVKTTEHNIKEICEYTGLSESTVSALHNTIGSGANAPDFDTDMDTIFSLFSPMNEFDMDSQNDFDMVKELTDSLTDSAISGAMLYFLYIKNAHISKTVPSEKAQLESFYTNEKAKYYLFKIQLHIK